VYRVVVIDVVHPCYVVISGIVGFKVGVVFLIWSFFTVVLSGVEVDFSYCEFFVFPF
jgi:hypothetical protein